MKKIIIVLKESVDGQKQFEFTSESTDLSGHIDLARDKSKMFSLSNIKSIYLTWDQNGKLLNMTEMLLGN